MQSLLCLSYLFNYHCFRYLKSDEIETSKRFLLHLSASVLMHGTRVKVARKSTLHFKYGRCLEDQAEEKQPTSRRKSSLQDQQPALQMIANQKPTFPDEDCMLHVKFQNHSTSENENVPKLPVCQRKSSQVP